jgi:hypothetical protein
VALVIAPSGVAQLVAEHREELVLGAVGELRLAARRALAREQILAGELGALALDELADLAAERRQDAGADRPRAAADRG